MLKNVGIATVLVGITFLIGIFMMPPKIEIIRYIDVEAPPDKVWSHVSTVEAWDSWDPWSGKAKNGKRPWKEGVLTIEKVNIDKQEISLHQRSNTQ